MNNDHAIVVVYDVIYIIDKDIIINYASEYIEKQ